MLQRPSKLRFYTGQPSFYAINNSYYVRKPAMMLTWLILITMVPFVSVRTYARIERQGYWEGRIEKKRVKKMAFDYMLKS